MVNIGRCMDLQPRENVPNDSTVELNLGHSGFPILTQGRFNVEHRQHTSDDEVDRLKSQVPTGTDPTHTGTIIHKSGAVWMIPISYLLPAPKTLSSGLNTSGLIFPSLMNLSGLNDSGSG